MWLRYNAVQYECCSGIVNTSLSSKHTNSFWSWRVSWGWVFRWSRKQTWGPISIASYYLLQYIFLMPPHVHTNFRGPPSWLWRKCNRLLRLGRPWGAVTLSRWCEGWYIGRWGSRRGLKSRSTNYPDHGHHGDPPPTRKISMVQPGIEPGTSWLVVRSSDH